MNALTTTLKNGRRVTYRPAAARSLYGELLGRTIETIVAYPTQEKHEQDGYLVEVDGLPVGYVTFWDTGKKEPWSAQKATGILPDGRIVLEACLRSDTSRGRATVKMLRWVKS